MVLTCAAQAWMGPSFLAAKSLCSAPLDGTISLATTFFWQDTLSSPGEEGHAAAEVDVLSPRVAALRLGAGAEILSAYVAWERCCQSLKRSSIQSLRKPGGGATFCQWVMEVYP